MQGTTCGGFYFFVWFVEPIFKVWSCSTTSFLRTCDIANWPAERKLIYKMTFHLANIPIKVGQRNNSFPLFRIQLLRANRTKWIVGLTLFFGVVSAVQNMWQRNLHKNKSSSKQILPGRWDLPSSKEFQVVAWQGHKRTIPMDFLRDRQGTPNLNRYHHSKANGWWDFVRWEHQAILEGHHPHPSLNWSSFRFICFYQAIIVHSL